MTTTPDFFLSTAGETDLLAVPRACWARARLSDCVRDDYMAIDIDPPLPWKRSCLGVVDVTQLLISTRLHGQTLYPIAEWPVFVYIARIIDSRILIMHAFKPGQVELIAWGALFRTLEEAVDDAKAFQE